jgi:hypothetical protein
VEFLASDALRGRGSATDDEWVAAVYVAAQLRQLGLEPAGDAGGYLQRVELERHRVASAVLTFRAGGDRPREGRFTHGQEIAVARLGSARVSGPLRRLRGEALPPPQDLRGAVVLLDGTEAARRVVGRLLGAGVGAVLVRLPRDDRRWKAVAAAPLALPVTLKGRPGDADARGSVVLVEAPVMDWLERVRDGGLLEISAEEGPPEPAVTWNVLAALTGKGKGAAQAVLLSAHIDHLGTNPALPGDAVFNGADDDASGVAAVLEVARALSREGPARRTALFAFFGSEESGGLGSGHFLEHAPLPLKDLVANLQFEMLGRPDPAVDPGRVWLAGYERSDLGPELARQGAPVVPDPHPEENFFQRSDNYRLAQRGVVAHTVSSFGLHPDYHGVDDEVDRLDFAHLSRATAAMERPVRWLLDAAFVPTWTAGGRPR